MFKISCNEVYSYRTTRRIYFIVAPACSTPRVCANDKMNYDSCTVTGVSVCVLHVDRTRTKTTDNHIE